MPLYHFRCDGCSVIFEDVSFYSDELQGVVPLDCPLCDAKCGIVWIKSPGMHGDENLTREERVAAALKLGIRPDGRMIVPQTRTDVRKIKEAVGDFRVGAREITTTDSKSGDLRSADERDRDKAATIDFIRKRRAMRRAGELPQSVVDPEVKAIAESTPINSRRILARNGA